MPDDLKCATTTHYYTEQDGLKLLRFLRPLLLEHEIGIGLTGSLAYRGSSDKDIDLVLFPFHEGCSVTMAWLESFLKPLGFDLRYSGSAKAHHADPNTVLVTWYKNKRVDFLLTSR